VSQIHATVDITISLAKRASCLVSIKMHMFTVSCQRPVALSRS